MALFTAAGIAFLAAQWPVYGRLHTGPRLTIAAAILALFVSAIVFSSLTVRIAADRLAWHFGPGAVAKSVPLAEIANAEPTTTTVLDGWGIHLTRRGWLYNVGGRGAVLVTQRDGKTFLLGTDEPDALAQAIRAARDTAR